jgi:hypothetical protein
VGNVLKRLFRTAFPSHQDGLDATHPPGATDIVLRQATSMLKPVVSAYRRRYTQHGATPKGVFWTDAQNVKKRFDTLTRVFDPTHNAQGDSSISDLGCGYGALFDYLTTHPAMRGGTYRGYDICQSMLDACETRIRDPRATFHHAMRATQNADYSFVSGTFNLSMHADDDEWQAYVFASLQDLWDHTGHALAFNMLDKAGEDKLDGLFYADPQVFSDFCRANLSENVELITNYGLPDITIFVRR